MTKNKHQLIEEVNNEEDFLRYRGGVGEAWKGAGAGAWRLLLQAAQGFSQNHP